MGTDYDTNLGLQKYHRILASDGAQQQSLGATRSAGHYDHDARRVREVSLGGLAVVERAVSHLRDEG
jgi:hypothetical protein